MKFLVQEGSWCGGSGSYSWVILPSCVTNAPPCGSYNLRDVLPSSVGPLGEFLLASSSTTREPNNADTLNSPNTGSLTFSPTFSHQSGDRIQLPASSSNSVVRRSTRDDGPPSSSTRRDDDPPSSATRANKLRRSFWEEIQRINFYFIIILVHLVHNRCLYTTPG